jgi:hypothetical protein
MQIDRRINVTHKAINKPLTILGVERKLFFVALIMGAAAFNVFGSLLGGLLVFASLFLMAQWATRTEPADSADFAQFQQISSRVRSGEVQRSQRAGDSPCLSFPRSSRTTNRRAH